MEVKRVITQPRGEGISLPGVESSVFHGRRRETFTHRIMSSPSGSSRVYSKPLRLSSTGTTG